MFGVRLVLMMLVYRAFMSPLQNSEPQNPGNISSVLQPRCTETLPGIGKVTVFCSAHWRKCFCSLRSVKRPKFGSCCGTNLEVFAVKFMVQFIESSKGPLR